MTVVTGKHAGIRKNWPAIMLELLSKTKTAWYRLDRVQKVGWALLCVFLLLYTFSVFRIVFRSQNALDELYFASIDTRCYDAIGHGVYDIDVWLSAISPMRNDNLGSIEEVEDNGGGYYPLHGGVEGMIDVISPQGTLSNATTFVMCLDSANAEATTTVRWYCYDNEIDDKRKRSVHGRFLDMYIMSPISEYYCEANSDDYVEVGFSYNVETNTLKATYASIIIDREDSNRSSTYAGYLENLGIEQADFSHMIISQSLQIVEDRMLPLFLETSDMTFRFDSDFEQDGVCVDLSAEHLFDSSWLKNQPQFKASECFEGHNARFV